MKKPVLNPTLTLTLGLPAKHSNVFHCLYIDKLLVNQGELGLARLCRDAHFTHSPTLAHLELTKNLPLYN